MSKQWPNVPQPIVWFVGLILFLIAMWLVWKLAFGAGVFVGTN